MNIEINNFISTSISDGPGIRSVLFLQGCSIRCKNCHNKEAQNVGDGILYDIDQLIIYVKERCLNKKITISGGEPLEQYESVKYLVKKLSEYNFNICLYTGLTLEKVNKDIFKYLNYIKVGEFREDLKDLKLAFRGSSNQKIYKVLKGREVCLIEIEK
ncbi:radical SAM protein [Clostridium perfringens]|nr:radical SAM protein [Clostridium perfringens]EJT6656452.1 radical SAM protein [Clostridium perfringens]